MIMSLMKHMLNTYIVLTIVLNSYPNSAKCHPMEGTIRLGYEEKKVMKKKKKKKNWRGERIN